MPAKRCRIHLIAGARPNVMKIAPLYKALKDQAWCEPRLVFIAQHYSENMSSDLFAQFGVHDEIVELPLDADNYGDRMGGIIKGYSAFIEKDQPDMVVVPGDVDVALGAAVHAGIGNRAQGGQVDVAELSDDAFDNLPEAERKRLRGD